MRPKFLKLENLKVQSFVTDVKTDEVNTLKGGSQTNGEACNTPACSHLVCNSAIDLCATFGCPNNTHNNCNLPTDPSICL